MHSFSGQCLCSLSLVFHLKVWLKEINEDRGRSRRRWRRGNSHRFLRKLWNCFFPHSIFPLPPLMWMTACWRYNYVWKAITQTQAPRGTSEISPWRAYERMTTGGASCHCLAPVMIAAAFMTLQEIFWLVLPSQSTSDAVFKLKTIFTVPVLDAWASPYSSVLYVFRTLTAGDWRDWLRTYQEGRKHKWLCWAFVELLHYSMLS